MANLFVPKGYLCIDDAIEALKTPDTTTADARSRLRHALRAGDVRAVIQIRATGVLMTDDPRHWAGENGGFHLEDNGEVFLHAGETERINFGTFIPGAPDDVNFVQMPKGVWSDFLIIEKTLRTFLAGVPALAREPSSEESAASPAEIKPKTSQAGRERVYANWREKRGDNIPTWEEDWSQMKTLGLRRDEVRTFRREYSNRARGRPKVKTSKV